MNMKKRALFVSIFSTAVLGATMLLLQGGSEVAQYIPRSENSATGFAGAEAYNKMLRANVNTGEIEAEDILRIRKAYKSFASNQQKAAVGLEWNEMGPDNVGGRTRAIEINPNNPTEMFAGGVSGGLWRSSNGARTWSQVASFGENIIVSSLAFMGNGHLYVATGSSHDGPSGTGGSGFLGHGIYRTLDGGQTFENVVAPSSLFGGSEWSIVDEIMVDPNNNDGLWVAMDRGLRYYDESDDNFTTPSGVPNSAQTCEDVKVSADGSVVVASIGGDGYTSVDFGQNFENVTGGSTGLPTAGVGRIEFAISPDDKNFVYACIASTSGRMLGVFSSTNKGIDWVRIWPPGFGSNAVEELDPFNVNGSAQGNYDNCITVVPGVPEKVYVGGITLWSTALTGQPEQIALPATFPGCFLCVHSDIHEFEWHPNGDTLYIGTDGGVYKSFDDGGLFFATNRGYNVTQFYSVAYSPEGKALGGTQDTDSPYLNFEGPTQETSTALHPIGFTDGFDCDISQMDPMIIFASAQNGGIARSNDDGVNFSSFYDARILSLGIDNPNGSGGTILGDFFTTLRLFENWNDPNSPGMANAIGEYTVPGPDTITVADILGTQFTFEYVSAKVPAVPLTETSTINIDMIIDPDPVSPSTILYPGDVVTLHDTLPDRVESLFACGFIGNQGVWVTRGALTFTENPEWWKVIDNTCNVNALEFSGDGDHLFVGCSSGELRRVSGFNNAYDSISADVTSADSTRVLSDVSIASFNAPITGIAPHPTDPDKLFVTLGGYGGSGKVQYTSNATGNGSFSNRWISGTLAGMPVYDGIMDVSDPDIWVVGTEHGVFSSDDAGSNWTQENSGMSVVPTYAVRQQRWDAVNNPHNAGWIQNPGVIYLGTHGRGIFRSETLLGIGDQDESSNDGVGNGGLVIYPNPVNENGTISFELNAHVDVNISIYNMQGKLIDQIAQTNAIKGSNKVEFSVDQYPVGTYIAHLEAGNVRMFGRFVVLR